MVWKEEVLEKVREKYMRGWIKVIEGWGGDEEIEKFILVFESF